MPSVTGGQFDGSNQSVLRNVLSMEEATTRAEQAALFKLIPPTLSKPSSGIRPVYEATSSTNSDPLTLNVHPCKNIVKEAQSFLMTKRTRELNNPSGINKEGIGQFSEAGLSVLKQFCSLGSTRSKVCCEANWLNQLWCSSQDLARIQQALWHQSCTDIILRFSKNLQILHWKDISTVL